MALDTIRYAGVDLTLFPSVEAKLAKAAEIVQS
jgi:hypothetical protein